MRKWKTRLSLFLCILFVMPAVFGCIPKASIQVQAATTGGNLYWASGMRMGNYDATLKVEAGQTFHIGDYLLVYDATSRKPVSSLASVSYTSSDPSVASCRNGIITTFKSGTTVLTVSYQDKTYKCTLTVVDKGTLNMSAYKSLDNQVNKLLKVYGKKLTTKNQYQVYDLLSKLEKIAPSNTNSYGLRISMVKQTDELVVLNRAKADEIQNIVKDYVIKTNPIGTVASKAFQIKSVNAKKNQSQFTIGIKSKVTASQIFAIKADQQFDTYLDPGKIAKFHIYVRDKSTGHIYSGIATVSQGSKNIAVQMHYLVLKKNRTYQLLGRDGQNFNLSQAWTKGKTFKVK